MGDRHDPPDELEASIDALYRLPLADFTEKRNELAAARKTAGDKDGAARVKALLKPSVPAWAVNQVFWGDRGAFDAVVRAMAGVGAAQREAVVGSAGGDLREAMRRKAEALSAAARIGERRVVESGGAGDCARSTGSVARDFDVLS